MQKLDRKAIIDQILAPETDLHGSIHESITEQEKKDDLEALLERLDTVSERVRLHRLAVGYLADNSKDEQMMANLMMIEQGLERTENLIASILGQPEPHKDDIPY